MNIKHVSLFNHWILNMFFPVIIHEGLAPEWAHGALQQTDFSTMEDKIILLVFILLTLYSEVYSTLTLYAEVESTLTLSWEVESTLTLPWEMESTLTPHLEVQSTLTPHSEVKSTLSLPQLYFKGAFSKFK